jgi:hypothetical protein
MKFKSVKKASEIKLAGITATLDVVDNSTQSITLDDEEGNSVRIAIRSYNLYVEVPAPPETEKKYQLVGHVLDLPVDRVFDEKYEAENERRRLSDAAHAELEVKEIHVPVAA